MQPAQAIHPKLFVALTHVVGALVIALVITAFYWLAHRPLQTQQLDCEHRITQLKGLLDNSIMVRRTHVQLKKQLDELTSRVERTQKLTPGESEESVFLSQAAGIAEAAGLEIEDYRRGRVRHLPTHSELSITLSGSGSHESVCQFLAQMEALPRAKQITDLAIESSDDADYPFEVAYTLYFGMKTETVLPTAQAGL